jgi:rhodanese-related sulfurtransferase
MQYRVAVAVLFLGLMAGCSSSAGEKTSTADGKQQASTQEAFVRLDPAAFAERMKDGQAKLINVHIPYEGELENTDAFIPFDKIAGAPGLPEDKSTPILLYCRTGRMSQEAGTVLHEEGFTNIAHLEGGMKAWEAAGKPLIQNPAHAASTPAEAPTPMPKPIPHG